MEGICNRIGILHSGKLCIEGEVRALINDNKVENLEELFFKKAGEKNDKFGGQ